MKYISSFLVLIFAFQVIASSVADSNAPTLDTRQTQSNISATLESSSANNASSTTVNGTQTHAASKVPTDPVKSIDLSKPGVLKRAVLVFGGFGLVAVLYFIFYRRRQIKNNENNPNDPLESPQFRYGVLQSDDRMDLSQMPLTMESDEDDEEDLEIFDLGEKKKSYLNLNTDSSKAVEEIMSSTRSADWSREHVLLDIGDSPAVLNVETGKPDVV